MKKFIIITTINPKTEAITKFSQILKDWHIILVGDKKSKKIKNEKNIKFLTIEEQENLGFETIKYAPYNHYARKNIGYLYAMSMGADVIYDTDDDNIPYVDWKFPEFKINSKLESSKNKYINIYNYFTSEKIWPRGYPIDEINKTSTIKTSLSKNIKIGVWQGLADKEPDVDAIYRLIINKKIKFDKKPPIVLSKKTYCPFNSQNTLWNKEFFVYMYLPSYVNFRFTDILRGYVAQRLLWEDNYYLGFTKATVYQKRNKHNIMEDFKDEVNYYTNIKDIVDIINNNKFNSKDRFKNLKSIYCNLLFKKYVLKKELKILNAWIIDIKKINFK